MLRNAGATRLHTAFHSLLRVHNTATTLTAGMRGFPIAAQNAFSPCRQDGPLFTLSDKGSTSIGVCISHVHGHYRGRDFACHHVACNIPRGLGGWGGVHTPIFVLVLVMCCISSAYTLDQSCVLRRLALSRSV